MGGGEERGRRHSKMLQWGHTHPKARNTNQPHLQPHHKTNHKTNQHNHHNHHNHNTTIIIIAVIITIRSCTRASTSARR